MNILEKIKEMEKGAGNNWRPENPGDYLAGEALSELRTVNTKFGERQAIDVRSEEDGQVYTVWPGTVITNELKKHGVEVGDKVGFKFLGQKKNYNDYVVLVEKNGHDPGKSAPGEEEQEDNLGGQG